MQRTMRYVRSLAWRITTELAPNSASAPNSDSRNRGDEIKYLRLKIAVLERRLGELEKTMPIEKIALSRKIENDLQEIFEQKILEGTPNMSYFNIRFRDYEHIASNVKTLGYEVARQRSIALSAPPLNYFPSPSCSESRLCTQADMESAWLLHWCRELCIYPNYHRKNWEFCYIVQSLYSEGQLIQGKKALGFGCGDEPLPSLFAKYGITVVATDQAPEEMLSAGWGDAESQRGLLANILHPNICALPEKLQLISTANVDMNNISHDLVGQFDFCWSSCALEHLGSIENGLRFIENSLMVLKPGGVAVHTTEFNLDDSGETIDNWPTVLFQQKHFLELNQRLQRAGHYLAPLNFDAGGGVLDGYVDIPPYQGGMFAKVHRAPHLRLSIDGFICSSFGLVIRKGQLPDLGGAY